MNLIKFITVAVLICFIFASAMITQVAQKSIAGLNTRATRQGPSISLMNSSDSSAPIDPAPGSGGGGAGVF